MSVKSVAVRVRFAPSPTGFLHIGGLRTALYNYLFARKHKGVFVLRIEDTDQSRNVEGGVENIMRTLEWCGLKWDEGPKPPLNLPLGKGEKDGVGPYGPYIQSERLEIYQKHAQQLVKKGKAYFCVCTPERLEKLRQEQMARKEPTRYDGRCRKMKNEELRIKNVRSVVRLKVPEKGSTKFADIVHDKMEFENKLIDDQVLLKSDGFPTYHLANVVDDHLMKITHVIRGEEWLPSTPKHILLYKAFGWKPPQFAHLPLLLNPDKSKLSKRQGDVAVEDYIKKGYLREALINFVALLGLNPRADKELYTLDELIAEFDLAKVNKSGAVVNFEKLDWMNGHYIRQKPLDELVELAISYLPIEPPLRGGARLLVAEVVKLEQERLKKLSDLTESTEFFFKQPHYHAEILVWKKMPKKDVANSLTGLREFLTQYDGAWDAATLEKEVKAWITLGGRGVGQTLWPMRVALSGQEASPPPFDIAAILGKEETLKRLEYALGLAKKL